MRAHATLASGDHHTVHSKSKNSVVTRQFLLTAILLISAIASAQTQPVTATIDASKTGPPISKYIYGQFLEHIGGLVNNGLWAEMLDDRKFYFPITSHPPAEPAGPSWRRTALRHWTPIGADEFVTMDTSRPYVGDHTPLVKLSEPKRTESSSQAWLCERGNPIRDGSFLLVRRAQE